MQTIQWFPGHMAKARREITEKLNMVDLIIELKDARIPYSSTNPMIDEIVGNKARLILLNKSSIADPNITKEWMAYYKSKNILSLDIDSITNYHISSVIKYAELALKDVMEARLKKGIKSKLIKAMILGIPNVGKSTLINTLAKRKAAQTGDRPGVTKSQTWIKVTNDFILLDTPGILWPKFEDQMVGLKLAMCGSIKDEILDLHAITAKSIEYLSIQYPQFLKARYKLDELSDDPYDTIDMIARKRGCLLKGGIVDTLKVCVLIMNELRGNKIGAMSYEHPED
ncbi:MAG: ribosome biogenesis GTPase YlqF [Erysipelotrichaceae bacterium]|nr:ribosome biogenesis GTPase YlqF [Erysipelotrichaceae bacterium]